MDQGGIGASDLLMGLISFIVLAIPFQNVFAKAGFSRWWVLFLFLGPIGWFICWTMLAVREWPRKAKA